MRPQKRTGVVGIEVRCGDLRAFGRHVVAGAVTDQLAASRPYRCASREQSTAEGCEYTLLGLRDAPRLAILHGYLAVNLAGACDFARGPAPRRRPVRIAAWLEGPDAAEAIR